MLTDSSDSEADGGPPLACGAGVKRPRVIGAAGAGASAGCDVRNRVDAGFGVRDDAIATAAAAAIAAAVTGGLPPAGDYEDFQRAVAIRALLHMTGSASRALPAAVEGGTGTAPTVPAQALAPASPVLLLPVLAGAPDPLAPCSDLVPGCASPLAH